MLDCQATSNESSNCLPKSSLSRGTLVSHMSYSSSYSKTRKAMSTTPSNTSDLIRNLRQQLSLSQEKLAVKLGVSFKTVNRWENGHTTPSPMALRRIAELIQETSQLDTILLNQSFQAEELAQRLGVQAKRGSGSNEIQRH